MSTQCGAFTCLDDDAYCCFDDDDVEYCCRPYYYQTWWFWFILGLSLLIILSCALGCYRSFHKRRQMRYVYLTHPQQPPVYGAVVVTSNVRGATGNTIESSAPVQPPPYVAYPREKPPSYTSA